MAMKRATAIGTIILLLQPVLLPAAPPVAPRAIENGLTRTVTVPGMPRQFTLVDRMAHYRVPGLSVAVIEDCRIVDARGFGRTSVDGAAVTPRTLLQAGSISKAVAAVGALKLVEEGKLELDTDVRSHLGSWNYAQQATSADPPPTLRQLLRHTAGTTVAGMEGYVPGEPLPTLEQILNGQPPANTAAIRVETAPDTKWSYSGGGYVVAQAMMMGITDENFPQLMDRLVLQPAGMTDSSYQQPMSPEKVPHAAAGTGPDGAPLPGKWRIYPEMAAAGLWTTPKDLANFAIALARAVRGEDGRLLSTQTASQMMVRGLGDWGLGVNLGPPQAPRQFSHTGHTMGYTSMLMMYPDSCQGAVVMTNADEGGWLVQEMMRSIGDAYDWPGRRPAVIQSTIPLTDAVASRFVGTYRLRDFPAERFSISRKADGGLYWARKGHIGRDLLPESETRLFSPDSEMTLVAANGATRAQTLDLAFGGGKNLADRID